MNDENANRTEMTPQGNPNFPSNPPPVVANPTYQYGVHPTPQLPQAHQEQFYHQPQFVPMIAPPVHQQWSLEQQQLMAHQFMLMQQQMHEMQQKMQHLQQQVCVLQDFTAQQQEESNPMVEQEQEEDYVSLGTPTVIPSESRLSDFNKTLGIEQDGDESMSSMKSIINTSDGQMTSMIPVMDIREDQYLKTLVSNRVTVPMFWGEYQEMLTRDSWNEVSLERIRLIIQSQKLSLNLVAVTSGVEFNRLRRWLDETIELSGEEIVLMHQWSLKQNRTYFEQKYPEVERINNAEVFRLTLKTLRICRTAEHEFLAKFVRPISTKDKELVTDLLKAGFTSDMYSDYVNNFVEGGVEREDAGGILKMFGIREPPHIDEIRAAIINRHIHLDIVAYGTDISHLVIQDWLDGKDFLEHLDEERVVTWYGEAEYYSYPFEDLHPVAVQYLDKKWNSLKYLKKNPSQRMTKWIAKKSTSLVRKTMGIHFDDFAVVTPAKLISYFAQKRWYTKIVESGSDESD